MRPPVFQTLETMKRACFASSAKKASVAVSVMVLTAVSATAQNPFVQTWFTSDPAPMVHDGRLYV